MSHKNIYEKSIEKMEQSIARLENQLKRSRQLLDHDVTIDNRTQQNLNFTIKFEDEDENYTYRLTQSKVMIPHHATCRHRINTIPRQHSNSPSPSSDGRHSETPPIYFSYNGHTPSPNGHRVNYNSELYRSGASRQSNEGIRNERKFQPFNQIQTVSPHRQHVTTEFSSSYSKPHNQSQAQQLKSVQNLHPSRETGSSIDEEGRMNQMNLMHAQDLKNIEKNILPLSLYETRKEQPFKHVEESPQVFNYISQKPTINHHEVYTPQHQHQVQELKPMGITFSPKAYESTRTPQQKKWSIEPTTVGYQNNKKYFQSVSQKQEFMKSRQQQRKKRINTQSTPQAKSKEKQFQYLSRFEKQQTQKKEKANDLFLERKNMFLKNLKNSREKESTHKKTQERLRSKSQKDSFATSRKSSKLEISNRKQMSPKVKQLSQRLYSRSKERLIPCDHHRRHGQSIERQRFYSLIHQNSFVKKYVTKDQQQALFQQFRRQQQSVSSWPMKLMNYTYSKLKKINGASRYTIRKQYY